MQKARESRLGLSVSPHGLSSLSSALGDHLGGGGSGRGRGRGRPGPVAAAARVAGVAQQPSGAVGGAEQEAPGGSGLQRGAARFSDCT